ncbi:copper amine oxidase N-terminal domain-containing protein [Paenibacillus sp. NFR01]|uniref:copper amine oxidase N-terminal domain-containing protein n=1 Tax=Paenibacillus sp. NFR01 TaxID=1566279 RepID=UPI0008C0F498|nr:copper amine oxidase N-terminal domain-containing protein [Paenibacillus sp. NFR01]SET17676.1 Copper amine oxidase N-terminal domain-containing protein [Paenibacillus sp. NFR01]
MKNKLVAVILSMVLLAGGTGGFAQSHVWAAGSVKIIVNGQALQNDPLSAYMNEAAVMLPLRETMEALKYKTTYQGLTGIVQMYKVESKLEYRLGGNELVFGDGTKLALKDKWELKQGRLYVPLSFFTALGLLTAYHESLGTVDVYNPEVTAGAVAGLLAAGKVAELKERYLGDSTDPALGILAVKKTWDDVTATAGGYFGIAGTASSRSGGTLTIRSVLSFTGAQALLTLALDEAGQITGFKLEPLAADQPASSVLKP